MKYVATTLLICGLCIPSTYALDLSEAKVGESFNKVMAKNRSRKGIANSNYVEIKGNEDLEKQGKKPIGLTVDKKVGTVYNYVEIKNVKSSKNKFKKTDRKYGMDRFKKDEEEKPLYGVKVKKGFKGKVNNTVKIENSTLD